MAKITCEAHVKREVKKILKDYAVWWYMPVQTGYGVQGIPDFIICADGKFLCVETKFKNNPLSLRQAVQRDAIESAGGEYLLITEENLVSLEAILTLHNVPRRSKDNGKPRSNGGP